MKPTLISIICLAILTTASAHKKSPSAKTGHAENVSAASILEIKIRKAWEDYKKKDKNAFAAILAPGFAEVTNDADGIFGKDEELAEMDRFNLVNYELTDFKLREVGTEGVVMTYTAQYSGSYANAPIQMKALYGEVWVKNTNQWKLLWVQETKLK